MSSREVIQRLQEDGWYEAAHQGSHKQFKHTRKTAKVAVPARSTTSPSARFAVLKNSQVSAGGEMDYIGYLHKDPKSEFGVSFADFPGCLTAGKSLDEASRKVPEAL